MLTTLPRRPSTCLALPVLALALATAALGMLLLRAAPFRTLAPNTLTTTTTLMSSSPCVIVVGSGLAGLSAAHEALRAGAPRVHLLDRAPRPGGNSIKAASGINGAGTRFQRAAGVSRDDLFLDDTVRSAGGRFALALLPGEKEAAAHAAATPHNGDANGPSGPPSRRRLVETLTHGSRGAVEWLADEFGVDMTVVAALGGHSLARTHRGAGKTPPGADIITRILTALRAFGEDRFVLESSAEVIALSTDAETGAVTGVQYTHHDQTLSLAGPVVFAAGGFAGDTYGLLTSHRPDLAGLPSTNDRRPAPHGILSAVGATFVDMDSVQVHPSGFIDPADPSAAYKFLAAEALRGEGGILLNAVTGGRFVNEMGTREQISRAIMALPPIESKPSSSLGDGLPVRQWGVTVLLDPGASEALAGHLSFYLFKGLLQQTTVRDLSAATIQAVDDYAAAVAAGQDRVFGRCNFGRWQLPPGEANRDAVVYIGAVTPVVHFTMGGAVFDTDARVLRERDGRPVGGLWAAGEITGGVHGDNRLGGSSLLECVVFGRIAGREAARELDKSGGTEKA
jgi:flavocytochrome c